MALALTPPATRAVVTPTVFITPAARAAVGSGVTVHFAVNVSGMPAFNGFNILVKTNTAAVTLTSLSSASVMFASSSEDINCVNNGVGITAGLPGNIGCVAGLDGPGIAHDEVFCLGCFTSSDHGQLFNITYTGLRSPTAAGTVVDLYNVAIDKPPITVPHIDVSGMYGTAQPDFTISASPISQSIPQGKTGTATISLTSVNAFAGTVTLNSASIAAGIPVTFNTTSVSLTAGATRFVAATVSPTATNAGGRYNVILNATAPIAGTNLINLIHATDLNITVTVPSFSIVASPASLVNPVGSTNTTTLTLTSANTFTAKVNVSFTVSPNLVNGPTITLTNSSFTGRSVTVVVPSGGTVSVTLTVSSTTATATNAYSITVKGVGGGVTTTATVSDDVTPFSITASPVSVTLTNSTSGFATSTLTINNLTPSQLSVDFTSSLSPPASNGHPLTIFFANSTAATPSPGLPTLTQTVPASGSTSIILNVTEFNSCFGTPIKCTALGTYNVKATGTIGTASRAVVVAATVTGAVAGPNFTISATSPVNFNTGATGAATTVTVTAVGSFTGTVTLTPTSPAGLTTACPVSVTLPPSPATASCTFTSTTPGVYGVTITGTSGTLTHAAPVTVHVGDFSISATNPSGAAGASISSTVTLTSLQNFVGSVALSDTPLPAGLTCNPFTVTPVSLTANGTGTSSLSCTSPSAGTFSVTITGTGSPGTSSHPTTAVFTFGPGGDFGITATTPADFNTGATGSSTITITPSGGFTGAVSITTVVSPATGLAANCPTSLTVVSGAVTGTCAPSSTTPGTYLVTITGTSGALSHSTSFVSHVGDFTISLGSPVNFNSGAAGSISVSLTSTFNFAGSITLTGTSGAGLTITCPATAVAITANATVASSCSLSSTTAGIYGINVHGTGSPGTASHTVPGTVHVGDFTISASTPVNFNSGATGSSISVSLTSTFNFAGTIGLTTIVSPAGLTVTCPAPVSITANATVATSCTLSSTTAGTYGVSITGAGSPGSASHSVPITVHVGDFTVSATSPSGVAGASIASTITLTSTFNFVGTVGLTDIVPAGLTCNPFTVTPVSLTANATGTSSLTCTPSTGGAFPVPINGAGSPGTAAHSTTATFTVGVADFSISASSPADFNNGATGSSTITVTPSGGFTGTILFTTTISPSIGLTANCPPSLLLTGPSAVTGTCSPTSTTSGTYLVTVTGTGGGHAHSTSFISHVGDFTISATGHDLNVGQTGVSVIISLTSSFNFAGSITLTSTAPAGLTITCPATAVAITANATVASSCSLSSTTAGTFPVSVSGAGSPGTASHSAPGTVHVGDFTISATSPVGFTGSSITSTVTLTSTFSFAGTVALTEAGLTCNPFTVTPVSLAANGTGTSSLSCTSPTAGSFVVNISGAGSPGTASHSTSATFSFSTAGAAQLSSAVTDGNLCGFGSQFRLIFTQSNTKTKSAPVFTLVASNPGQFAYNVFFNGTAGTPVTLSITVPYPFVTQGTSPIQVFSNFSLQPGCFVPINNISNGFTTTPSSIALADYGAQALGSTVTITVSGNIPTSGFVYITVHLNYGLKGSSFGQSGDDATNPSTGQLVVPDDATYSFAVSAGSLTDTQTVTSENVFKQDRVVAGIIIDQMGSPVANIPVSLFNSEGNLVAMAFTDADGFVGFHPHISGKSTFTVESLLPDGTIISQIVTVKPHHLEFLSFSVIV